MRMLNRMVVSNLTHRPVRSLISILAVAIEVALILLIVGLTDGMVNDSRNRIAGIGADIMVRPESVSPFAAISGNALPLKMGNELLSVPDVQAVAPVAVQFNGNVVETVSAIDLKSFNEITGGLTFLEGDNFTSGNQVVIDDLYASSHHLHAGDHIKLLNHDFTVTGVYESGKGSREYIPLATLYDIAGGADKCAFFYIKLADPSQTDAIVAEMNKRFPGYTIQPMKEYLSLLSSSNITGVSIFQRIMIGIAVAIGFLVVFLSMYTVILERTREIGILKSLGASRAFIVRAILRENWLLALFGIVLGVVVSLVTQHILKYAYPTLTITITTGWAIRGAFIAIVGSTIGALYPALKAANQDAIASLAYE